MDAAQVVRPELSRYEIPLSEGKAKEWIATLSTTDLGESTRRVFYGLIDFNRRMVPPLTRIRIAERLRPKIELMVINLQRHLTYQAFPLPARGKKISELTQSLLLEYAGTYQLAALDMLTKDTERKRALQIAIYRVIDYLGMYLLSTYSVYIRTRETVWHDIHHMYLLASERGLDAVKFNDGNKSAASIEARYIQVNLLALFKPYSLRQEETLRIARYIEKNTQLVSISREPIPEERLGKFVHAVVLNNDEPALIMPEGDLPHSPTVRVFNIRRLIMQIDQFIDEIAYENSSALILTNGLSRNLAKRMVYHLTNVRHREYNRFERNEKLSVVMGMGNVLQTVSNAMKTDTADQTREEDLLFNNMLYGGVNSIDVPPDEEEKAEVEEESGVRIWTVTNSSARGYGLHWEGQESSDARVGELAGLRDLSREDSTWMIGVIKWMETLPKKGLYCGVELLSVEVEQLRVLSVDSREVRYNLPQNGLMLPASEGIREEPVMILPAYIFRPGDQLTIEYGDVNEGILLTTLDECLGAFAYFRFKVTGQTKQQAMAAEGDDFGALWEQL